MNRSYVLDYVVTEGFDTNESIRQNGVYKIYHVSKPDWIYIGSASVTKRRGKKMTIGFHCRFIEHLSKLRGNKHHSKLLQRVVNKYGIDGLRIEIVEVTSSEDCLDREQYYIDLLSPKYNTYRKTVSSSGYSLSKQQLGKISKALKGRSPSAEVRDRISKSLKGVVKDTSHLRTKEVRDKVRAKLKGRLPSEKCIAALEKSVYMYSMEGEFLAQFDSIEKAAKETHIDRASISKCAVGKRKSAGKFRWSFKKLPFLSKLSAVKIVKYSLRGDKVAEYNSLADAAKSVGASSCNAIRNCFVGKQRQAYGYKWARENGYKLNHLSN